MNRCVGWFEGEHTFASVPTWARWFIELGQALPATDDETEHLLLVSTPCDSPAAALAALGIVMRDLTRQDATDVYNHARHVRAWVRKNPRGKMSWNEPNRRRVLFEVTSLDPSGLLTLTEIRRGNRNRTGYDPGPLVMKFGQGQNPDDGLLAFTPEDEAWSPVQRTNDRPALQRSAYSWIDPGWHPIEQRLSESYSGACLAGRKAGERGTKEYLQKFGFTLVMDGVEQQRSDLSSMLTIDGWGPSSISRFRYCNTRGDRIGNFDQRGTTIETVIADGASELIGVMQNFRSQNLIAFIPRDSDAERIENIAQGLADRNYSRVANDLLPDRGDTPRGVSIEWRVKR